MYNKEYQKKYACDHKEKLRKYIREYNRKKKGYKERVKNEYSGLSIKDRLKAIRLTVLQYYGGTPPRCACCGEMEIRFLAIDHIKNNGAKHRKEIGGNITYWLLKNGLPGGFQILCHNCNMAKGFYGVCPHKEKLL